MASTNPDSARNLGTARVLGERGFPAEGQAKHSLSVQERARKRKWNISGDEHRVFEGGDITTRHSYAEITDNYRVESGRPQSHGPEKTVRLYASHSNALDPDRSKRHRHGAPDFPRQNNPRKRNKQNLEKAQQLAPNYPDLRDIEAWQKLGQNIERKFHREYTFVYRQLRLNQCPKALAYTEWRKRVQQEMVGLGLQDAYTRPFVDRMPGGEVKDEAKKEVTQEAMKEAEEERARREMDRMIADDGLDIDIYGDEETRRKYEPWIRSRMDRT